MSYFASTSPRTQSVYTFVKHINHNKIIQLCLTIDKTPRNKTEID